MSRSSKSNSSDLEKETGIGKDVGRAHFTEEHEDIALGSQPPFTEFGDNEKQAATRGTEADGGPLTNISSKPSVNNIKSVPNGGSKAWMQVLGTFFVFFNTWGIINAVSKSTSVA